MQDKQKKGIGQYKNRPGYFWGGLVGGAILGALVNKMQGKDWKRGAMWGGITGGLGSAMVGPTSSGWLSKMNPGMTKSLLTMGQGNPGLFGSIAGAGGAWMAGDSEYDEEKWRQKKLEEEAKRKAEQRKSYRYWHTNPFATGGIATARPGYPGGGSATLEYTDPDLYTPTGEGGGPSSRPILQIPLGPEGSFAEEFEELDMSSASDPMDEWDQMYQNYLLEGGTPMPLPDFIEMMLNEGDFTPDYGAQGGYKKRPKYRDAGEVMDEGFGYDVGVDDETYNVNLINEIEDPNVRERLMKAIIMSARLKQPEGRLEQDTIDRTAEEFMMSGIGAGSEDRYNRQMSMVEDKLANLTSNPMAFRAEGGIADLDMTKGGASNGPGTGTSDDIPAMLSDGEFVVTANAVKNLGGGDRMLGARKMYSMMNQLDPSSQTPAEMSTVGMA